MNIFKTTIIVLILFSFSCGEATENSNNGKSNNGEASDISETCDRKIERGTQCGEVVDKAKCQSDALCLQKRYNPAAFDSIAECEIELACGVSDDPCYDANYLGLTSSTTATAYIDKCTPKAEACGLPVAEMCNGALIFADAVLVEIETCFELPCDEIQSCARGKLNVC